ARVTGGRVFSLLTLALFFYFAVLLRHLLAVASRYDCPAVVGNFGGRFEDIVRLGFIREFLGSAVSALGALPLAGGILPALILGAGAYLFWWVLAHGKSGDTLPRQGTFLYAAVSDDGTFPIWHRESDLHLIDLASGERRVMTELNSDQSESYHSWDSSGRWLIFVSRRDDTLYTRVYIAHIDEDGNGSKPFLLPQRQTADDTRRMKSYNLPEPMVEPIPVSIGTLTRAVTLKAPRRAAYQKQSDSNRQISGPSH
ncbi:MAG: hypothetical protein J6S75_04700, partial [Thermoguttaceae bacterium]|nr:hypothetical protein [Thermoguttaceae bacterium]